jgi:hypothetical protein
MRDDQGSVKSGRDYRNIMQIWKSIGQECPFAVRRAHWSDRTYAVVDEVIIGKWPYGFAYGHTYVQGVRQAPRFASKMRSSTGAPEISCAGCYQWYLVEMPGSPMRRSPSGLEMGVATDD